MLNLIYTLKACLLLMYSRLTRGTEQQRGIRYLNIYVILGWIATQITFFTACRPFNGYWAVPTPNHQCATFEHYAILQATFNISSDIAMIAIAVLLVYNLNLSLKQKIILGVIFSMGVFVVRLSPAVLPRQHH